jgi:hypothetical protein
MSGRFTIMFFTMLLLVNFFFLDKIEPSEHAYVYDKLLSLFLFQCDYFLLSAYIVAKAIRNPSRSLFTLSLVYCILFVVGLSSIYITDQLEFDIFYSYIQPLLRLALTGIFVGMGLKSRKEISKRETMLILLFLLIGLLFLILMLSIPRPDMGSFYFYWLGVMTFAIVGVLSKFEESKNIFLLGLFCILLADLYYILPEEMRFYDLTYIYVRVLNTLGEFLIVNYILKRFTKPKARINYPVWGR